MIMFFFLLLMLALAWGITDHLQGLQTRVPPTAPAPVPSRVETSVPLPPPVTPPANVSLSGDEPADGTKPDTPDAHGKNGEADDLATPQATSRPAT